MGFFSRSKKVIKKHANVKYFVSYDEHKNTWSMLQGRILDLFRLPDADRSETFEEAVERLQLTKMDILRQQNRFLAFSLLFFALGALMLLYIAWLLSDGDFVEALLGVCVSGILFVNGFRYHFWYFQIKHRKLGCTFKEWMNSSVQG